MEVFYIDIEEFKKNHNKDFLLPYADREFKIEKRFWEYAIGRYLIKNIAERFYDIKNAEILIDKNGKPYFKNNEIYFSLTHSKNIVMACFDKSPCGIDLEFIKDRNLDKLSKYYDEKFNTLEKFYKFWTLKEAEYKLNEKAKCTYFNLFNNEYYLALVSNNLFNQNICPRYFK